MIYFFLLRDFTGDNMANFSDGGISLKISLFSWDSGVGVGFVDDDDSFVLSKLFILPIFLRRDLVTNVDFVDVDIIKSIEESSSSLLESVNECDGISLSLESMISLVLIKSSEVIVFDFDSSVGNGSPGWTVRESMNNQTYNERNKRGKRLFLLGKITARKPQKRRKCIIVPIIEAPWIDASCDLLPTQ